MDPLAALEERLNKRFDDVDRKLDNVRTRDLPGIQTEIALLKANTAVRGAVAGTIASCVVIGGIALVGLLLG